MKIMNALVKEITDLGVNGDPLYRVDQTFMAGLAVKKFLPEVAYAIVAHSVFMENAELQALKDKGLITEEQLKEGVVRFSPKISVRREGVIPPWESRVTSGLPEEIYMSTFKQVGDEVGRAYAGFPIMTEGQGLLLPKAAFHQAFKEITEARAQTR